MGFGTYTPATCPAGKTVQILRGDGVNVCRTSSSDTRPTAPTCPAGTTVYSITTADYQTNMVCIPSGTTTYAPDPTDKHGTGCRAGDGLGTSATGWFNLVCVPASSTPASSDTSLGGLSTQYTKLKADYDSLANQALSNPTKLSTVLPQLQSVNQQMASLVDQMLKNLQYATSSPNSDAYRDQLVETLARIQSDYNGLKTETDALQTLKRIRSFQDTSWQSSLNLYVGLFLLFAIVLIAVMIFRHQKSESTTAPSTSPIAMPPLT